MVVITTNLVIITYKVVVIRPIINSRIVIMTTLIRTLFAIRVNAAIGPWLIGWRKVVKGAVKSIDSINFIFYVTA